MNIQNAITIDLMRPGITRRTYAVEGDSGTRTVQLLLRRGDEEWTVPDGTAASVVYSKSDGTSGWYDTLPDGAQACTIDGSTITVALAPQMMAVSGIVAAAVILRDGDGNRLSTFDFLIDVRSSPADDTAIGDYYNLRFGMSMEELQAWIDQTEQTVDGTVRFSQVQELSEEQQAQARENIGAVSADEVSGAIEKAVGSGSSSHIPDYWEDHINSRIKTIKALQDAGGRDTVSFAVLTDMHHYSNLGKNAPLLARKIMDECGIKYALVLGDTQNRGSWVTKALAEAEFEAVDEMLAPIEDRMLRTQGNHDGSWGAALNGVPYPYNYTPEELYNRIYRKSHTLDGIHIDDTGTACYVDDDAAKFRYIVLNSHCNAYEENEDGSARFNNRNVFRFTQSQYDMVVDALSNMPEGYSVAVFAHVPISNAYADLFGNDHVMMRGLLKAYKFKASYTESFAGTDWDGAAYTNLAGTIAKDVRLSSSGEEKASEGAVITDYIACSAGDILQVKNLDIISEYLPDGVNSPAIAVYDSGKKFLSTIYPKSYTAAFMKEDGVTEYLLFTNNSGEQIGLTDPAYIRVCGIPVDGADVIVTINEVITETDSCYDAVYVSADFSEAKGEFVGYFSGHMHQDCVYPHSDWGIDIITTRCDAQEEDNSTLNAERVAGTTTEQSFDVFTVNTKERRIYATKIGAGDDRQIDY